MKETKVDFVQETDILGQHKSNKHGTSNHHKTTTEEIDYSKNITLPSLKTRYITTLIDVFIIVLISLGIGFLFELIGNVPEYLRGLVFAIVIVLYEPIFVATACTPGQYFNGVRVRKFKSPNDKISFFNALFRIISKSLLGWLSFITLNFNKNKRAIHDYVSGSFVIEIIK